MNSGIRHFRCGSSLCGSSSILTVCFRRCSREHCSSRKNRLKVDFKRKIRSKIVTGFEHYTVSSVVGEGGFVSMNFQISFFRLLRKLLVRKFVRKTAWVFRKSLHTSSKISQNLENPHSSSSTGVDEAERLRIAVERVGHSI